MDERRGKSREEEHGVLKTKGRDKEAEETCASG